MLALRAGDHALIGYLGGSFDPIHRGHTHLIKSLLDEFQFDKFFVCPTGNNPLKEPTATSGKDRLAMVRLALDSADLISKIALLDWEVSQQGPSYTVNTIEKLTAQEGKRITLIIGDDVFPSLPQWHRSEALLKLVDLLVVSRTKTSVNATGRHLRYFKFDALPISATELRRQISNHVKTDHMTQCPSELWPNVWAYIKKNHLYSVGS